MELERAFARGWTGPRQTIVTVALCNRDNGKSKFFFLFWESIRTVDDVSMWFYDLIKQWRCASGHTTCNPRVPLRAPVLQLCEERHWDWQQSVQRVESLSGLSPVCAAHHHRQLSSSIQVRWKPTNLVTLMMHIHYTQRRRCLFFYYYLWQTIYTVPFAAVPVPCSFFSATWNTSINYLAGMLSIQ